MPTAMALSGFRQDARLAVRLLRKHKSFSFATIRDPGAGHRCKRSGFQHLQCRPFVTATLFRARTIVFAAGSVAERGTAAVLVLGLSRCTARQPFVRRCGRLAQPGLEPCWDRRPYPSPDEASLGRSCRLQEIGIRLALGAKPRQILELAIRRGMTIVVVGVAVGFAAWLGLMRVMMSWLYKVAPTDPITLAGVTIALSGVALTIICIAAHRAVRVDPMHVLCNN
jgi:hypothetical protein